MMDQHFNRPKNFRISPWPIIALLELLLIIVMAVQIAYPRERMIAHGSGMSPVLYKYQDSEDTDGNNFYGVVVLAGIPYTVELDVTPEEYQEIICDIDVWYSVSYELYASGKAKLLTFKPEPQQDYRPDSEKNSPAPGG